MGRAVLWAAIFLIAVNAWAGLLISTGIAADLGIQPSIGEADELDAANSSYEDVNPENSDDGTLFGFRLSLGNVFGEIVNTIFPAAGMLKAANVPGFIVDLIFAPTGVWVSYETISFLRSGS